MMRPAGNIFLASGGRRDFGVPVAKGRAHGRFLAVSGFATDAEGKFRCLREPCFKTPIFP